MRIDFLLDRAFELALFIHADRQIAVSIVGTALARHRCASAIEAKHVGTYKPAHGRTKVPLGSEQILQLLVFRASQVHERSCEQTSEPTCDDMAVRYIEQIAKWSLQHNSFYACVGVLRVLCSFETVEALQAFDSVNGPDKSEEECRRIKKACMAALTKRFGSRLERIEGDRGEHRFATRQAAAADIDFAVECLTLCSPWGTRHVIPLAPPREGKYLSLPARGATPDEDAANERGRIHAFLEPLCCGRLVLHAGSLSKFSEHLMIPKCSQASSSGNRADRRAPPLNEDERAAILAVQRDGAYRRRAAASGEMRLRVDGIEQGVVHRDSPGPIELAVPAGTEVVELVGTADNQEVVLATYFVYDDEDTIEGERAIAIDWPLRDEVGEPGASVSDSLGAALDHLARRLRLEAWGARLRHWTDQLEWRSPVMAYSTGMLAAQLRAEGRADEGAIHDVLLSPDEPELHLDVPAAGAILVGVERWPDVLPAPLVILVPDHDPGAAQLAATMVDESLGLLVAAFHDVPQGRYVVALESSQASRV